MARRRKRRGLFRRRIIDVRLFKKTKSYAQLRVKQSSSKRISCISLLAIITQACIIRKRSENKFLSSSRLSANVLQESAAACPNFSPSSVPCSLRKFPFYKCMFQMGFLMRERGGTNVKRRKMFDMCISSKDKLNVSKKHHHRKLYDRFIKLIL